MNGEQYEIKVAGHVGQSWSEWLDGLAIYHTPDGQTLLSGPLIDQSALHGILQKIRDMGLVLIAVNKIETEKVGGTNEH